MVPEIQVVEVGGRVVPLVVPRVCVVCSPVSGGHSFPPRRPERYRHVRGPYCSHGGNVRGANP